VATVRRVERSVNEARRFEAVGMDKTTAAVADNDVSVVHPAYSWGGTDRQNDYGAQVTAPAVAQSTVLATLGLGPSGLRVNV
jgi:hypothetical protein